MRNPNPKSPDRAAISILLQFQTLFFQENGTLSFYVKNNFVIKFSSFYYKTCNFIKSIINYAEQHVYMLPAIGFPTHPPD
jgi:hypothetical protein